MIGKRLNNEFGLHSERWPVKMKRNLWQGEVPVMVIGDRNRTQNLRSPPRHGYIALGSMGLAVPTKNLMASQNFCIEQPSGLDGPSSRFLDRDYISNLPAQDAVRLVEQLDGVRTTIST